MSEAIPSPEVHEFKPLDELASRTEVPAVSQPAEASHTETETISPEQSRFKTAYETVSADARSKMKNLRTWAGEKLQGIKQNAAIKAGAKQALLGLGYNITLEKGLKIPIGTDQDVGAGVLYSLFRGKIDESLPRLKLSDWIITGILNVHGSRLTVGNPLLNQVIAFGVKNANPAFVAGVRNMVDGFMHLGKSTEAPKSV